MDLIARYLESDGLQSNDFNFGATYLDSSGNIFLGGANGYNIITPNLKLGGDNIPEIVLTNFSANTTGSVISFEKLEKIQKIEFLRADASFSVSFGVLDFLDPKSNQTKYRLEGHDTTWIDSNHTHTASYTNLPVGDYKFRVIGANSAGTWNYEGASIDIRILPNWWETRLALYTACLAIVVMIWLSLRAYRTYVLKNQAIALADEMSCQAFRAQNELEEERDYQDEVIKAIHAQNETTLNLIRACAVALDERDSGVSLAITGHLYCLGVLEESYHYQTGYLLANLHSFIEKVSSHLLEERSPSDVPVFTINQVPDELLPASLASPVAIIFYELIQNAIEHAFDADQAVGYIDICFGSVTEEGSGVPYRVLSVSDSGRGLPPGIDPLYPTTAGLSVVLALAQSLGGSVVWDKELEGTGIEVHIPLLSGQSSAG